MSLFLSAFLLSFCSRFLLFFENSKNQKTKWNPIKTKQKKNVPKTTTNARALTTPNCAYPSPPDLPPSMMNDDDVRKMWMWWWFFGGVGGEEAAGKDACNGRAPLLHDPTIYGGRPTPYSEYFFLDSWFLFFGFVFRFFLLFVFH